MSKSNTAHSARPISQEGADEYKLSDVAAAILPLSRALESEKSAVDRKPAPAYDPDKDYISTLLLELSQATAVVDLLFMVECEDQTDSLAEGALEGSLATVLERLRAVKVAADAILDEKAAARSATG